MTAADEKKVTLLWCARQGWGLVDCPAPVHDSTTTHMCEMLAAFSGLHKKRRSEIEKEMCWKRCARASGGSDWGVTMSKMHCECIWNFH